MIVAQENAKDAEFLWSAPSLSANSWKSTKGTSVRTMLATSGEQQASSRGHAAQGAGGSTSRVDQVVSKILRESSETLVQPSHHDHCVLCWEPKPATLTTALRGPAPHSSQPRDEAAGTEPSVSPATTEASAVCQGAPPLAVSKALILER